MKKLLLFSFLLLSSITGFAQSRADTLINKKIPAGSNSPTPYSVLNPVLLESLGNRVISFGSTPTMTTDSLFFANVKVKFGNSAVITVSGSVAIVAPDADPANYRVDFFVVKRNGTVRVITGTPGVQGITPIYDPNSEVVVFWWLINNTGTGTVTPVTYATLTQTRAGVATDLAINPYTFITVTQEMIDEALAGLMLGGGHALKYNATALPQRATLQVLSDDQGTYDDLRDSSAATSTILDLRNYIPYGGNDRYWRGEYRVGKPDGTEGLFLFSDDKPTTGVHFEHLLRNDAILYGVYRNATNRGSSIDLSYSRTLIKSGSTNSGIHPATSILLDSTVVSIQADLGARYFIQPFPVDSITASTRWDKAIPSVKILKDYVSAYGGSGGSVPTKIIRDTTNTSNNTLLIDKVNSGEGIRYTHSKDILELSMYGGDYASYGGSEYPSFQITRGDHSFLFSGGDGSTDGSSGDWAGIRGDRQYWLSSFYDQYHYVQKGGMDAAITAALGGGSVGTTTNALSVSTGLEFISGSSFNGAAARAIRLASGAAVTNLGFTPVSNVLSSGNMIVGSAGNVASPVTPSGDIGLSNAGVFTLPSIVTGATKTKITYNAKGQVTAGADATTSDIGEGTNLYFTNARGIGSTLTGWTSGAGTVSSSDDIKGALQKIDGNVALKSPLAGSSSITTLGTIGTGTWNGTAIAGQYGGTGVNNSGKTITLGGNLTTSGAFAGTFTFTGTTSVTFPTSGTLVAKDVPTTGTWASTITLNLTDENSATYTLTGNTTFNTSNLANGKQKVIRIICDGTSRNLTFPTGWTWLGNAAPTYINSTKVGVISIFSFGTADTDVVAAYSVSL